MHAPVEKTTRHLPLLCGLGLTRVIGWGSTYYAPALLVIPIQRDLALPSESVFLGITVLLVTGALFSPVAGRHFDSHGTRGAMMLGALTCGAGLALLAFSTGPVSFLASWVVIGIGHVLQLANAGNVTVAQLVGNRARRVIGLMMLGTGLASTVFWPLGTFLIDQFGWRATWLVFAALQFLIVLPIHWAIPRRPARPQTMKAAAGVIEDTEAPRVRPEQRRGMFWLLAIAFSASGFVSWGLPLHIIALMQNSGLSPTAAVALASLSGPATLLARLVDVMLGERLPVEKVALAGLALGPLSCVLLALAPPSVWAGAAFVVLFNSAMGVISVARATLPLGLFGHSGYGSLLGRLAVPQNLTFAAAPLIMAAMMARLGAVETLLISAAVQAAGLAAMLVLVARLQPPGPVTRP